MKGTLGALRQFRPRFSTYIGPHPKDTMYRMDTPKSRIVELIGEPSSYVASFIRGEGTSEVLQNGWGTPYTRERLMMDERRAQPFICDVSPTQ